MEKAYELKALGKKINAKLMEKGLAPLAEEALETAAVCIYDGTKEWAQESAVLSENKIDDMAAPFYNFADPLVYSQIAKIDIDGDGK